MPIGTIHAVREPVEANGFWRSTASGAVVVVVWAGALVVVV